MMTLPRIEPAGWRDLGPRLLWGGLALGLLLRAAAWFLIGDQLPVHGFEDCITVEQYDPRTDRVQRVTLSITQMRDLAAALRLPEGVYTRKGQ